MIACLPSPAAAYLDPGAGSMFIQGLVATLAAAGYAVRLHWARIQAWFRRSNDAPVTHEADDRR